MKLSKYFFIKRNLYRNINKYIIQTVLIGTLCTGQPKVTVESPWPCISLFTLIEDNNRTSVFPWAVLGYRSRDVFHLSRDIGRGTPQITCLFYRMHEVILQGGHWWKRGIVSISLVCINSNHLLVSQSITGSIPRCVYIL